MDATRLLVETFAASRRQLRVAVVTETYPPEINGVAMTTGRIVDGLLRSGHHVQLIRPRQSAEDKATPSASFDELLARGIPIPRYNHLKMGLPARQALIRAWSLHRPDVVQVVTEGPLGWSAVSAARKLNLPVVTEFHTNFHTYSRYYGVGWLKQPVAAYLRRFHNKGDLTLVPTESLRNELLSGAFKHVEVVARGVDTALFSPSRRSEALRHAWGADADTLVCILVSRIAPEKNLELAIRAFETIRAHRANSRFVIVGDGPARAALQTRYPEHVFAGMRAGENLAEHFASGDCFIFPSLTETFGNVITEALASGLPVLSFDYAAAREVIVEGSNGFVAPFGDEAAFLAAATRLAQSDAQLNAMKMKARESVLKVDWQAVVLQLVNVLDRTVQAHDQRTELRGRVAAQTE